MLTQHIEQESRLIIEAWPVLPDKTRLQILIALRKLLEELAELERKEGRHVPMP
jgi:DNA-binding transcriptional ArsR family regulator